MTETAKGSLPKRLRPWSRRQQQWEPPTVLDQVLDSPLRFLVSTIYYFLLHLRGRSFKPPANKPSVRIVCLSDTHTNTVPVPSGDVLVHAGDLTNAGTVEEIQKQLDWLAALPHREKIIITGNHDYYFDPVSRVAEDRNRKLDFKGIHYLHNKMVTLKFKGGRKLNFYGAGDSPTYDGAPVSAYQYERQDHPWSKRIPLETDVLITHTPPSQHLDLGLGCTGLLEEIWRVKPRVHIFGHVHSGHGREQVFWDQGQRAQERLSSHRESSGILADVIPSSAWLDAAKVVWYGIKGILWQWLMVGRNGGNGGILINAALVYQSTLIVGNPVEIVDI